MRRRHAGTRLGQRWMTEHGWQLLDTTLREGEQFAPAHFALADKLEIATALDAFGVRRLEVTNPVASPASRRACERLAGAGLRAKVLAHTRVVRADVDAAADAGAHGVNLLFATSEPLRRAGHGQELDAMLDRTLDLVAHARAQGLEVRFSCEDAFRTDPSVVRRIYRAVDAVGVDRLGIADTVGVATPRRVRSLVRTLRRELSAELEFHGHDDTGCAVANAFEAADAGAAWIDTSVLGLGERNGITPMGAFLARMAVDDPAAVAARYRLRDLPALDRMVARMAGVEIPFNSPVTGAYAYHHKAGLHLHAIANDPHAYEAVPAETFGLRRTLELGSALVGRHALAHRADQLGLDLDEGRLRAVTSQLKAEADQRPVPAAEVDRLLQRAAAGARVPA